MSPLGFSYYFLERKVKQTSLQVLFGLGVAGMLIPTIASWAGFFPARAHQVQVAEDIGGTLHIEPDDRPRAGEDALMWFALTRRGGTLLQLSECDCGVEVFQQPLRDDATPVVSPELEPVSAESYTGIPGANVAFPDIGAYTIVISGAPLTENDFQAFELSFDVNVVSR